MPAPAVQMAEPLGECFLFMFAVPSVVTHHSVQPGMRCLPRQVRLGIRHPSHLCQFRVPIRIWFFPTGSTKLMLTHQRSIVRGIVHDAIDILQAFLLFRNAFPDVPTAISFAREALSVAAGGYQPGGLLVRNRLQEDDEYALKLISLVCS